MKHSLKAGVAATAALALVGGGIAYAYYTDSAIGTATAQVNNPIGNLSVAVSVTGPELSPGGAGQTVTWIATNSSSTTITLSTATIQILTDKGEPWYPPAGCSASDFEWLDKDGNVQGSSFSELFGSGSGVAVEAGKTYEGSPATLRMINRPYNQNGCKGAVVPIYVNVG